MELRSLKTKAQPAKESASLTHAEGSSLGFPGTAKAAEATCDNVSIHAVQVENKRKKKLY